MLVQAPSNSGDYSFGALLYTPYPCPLPFLGSVSRDGTSVSLTVLASNNPVHVSVCVPVCYGCVTCSSYFLLLLSKRFLRSTLLICCVPGTIPKGGLQAGLPGVCFVAFQSYRCPDCMSSTEAATLVSGAGTRHHYPVQGVSLHLWTMIQQINVSV